LADSNQPITATIDSLLDRTSNGDLAPVYAELGALDPEYTGLAGVDNILELIHAGKQWWESQEPKLRAIVCGNPAVRACADGDIKDLALAVAAVLDGVLKTPNVACATVLIVRLGVKKWCATTWQNPSGV
jgi:hypothetical protein